MKRLIPSLLAASAAFTLIGAASSAAPTPAPTITLGASVQETGPLANTGRYYRDAYRFAVDKINAQGGVRVGDKHYRLTLQMLNNQSDKNLAVNQYVQLLTANNANFLLGPYSSGAVLATSSVAEKYQVPMVQGGGASDQIFNRGYKYVFGTLPVASQYFASTIDAMKKLHPEIRTVALLYAGDAFDVAVAKGARKLTEDGGFKLVVDERYGVNSSNFSSLLSQIKSENPDAILVAGHETEILNFIRQAKSLNVRPKLYSFTVGVPTADFRRALGADANYAFGMTPWLPSAKLQDQWFGNAEEFAKAYEKRFGYAPDYHSASAVADVEVYAKAIEEAGTLDPKKVRDAIAKVNFNSIYGHIQFQPNGQINLAQTMVQIQNGRLMAVYGEHGFINKPLYPMPSWNKA